MQLAQFVQNLKDALDNFAVHWEASDRETHPIVLPDGEWIEQFELWMIHKEGE